jgi:preprotein translocase subunit SecD
MALFQYSKPASFVNKFIGTFVDDVIATDTHIIKTKKRSHFFNCACSYKFNFMLVFIFFNFLGSCQYKQNTKNNAVHEGVIVYKLSIENAGDVLVDSIKIKNTIEVLRKRLLGFSVDPIEIYYEKSTRQFVIKTKYGLENNGRILLKPCKIEFYECFSTLDFYTLFDAEKSKNAIALKKDFNVFLGTASNSNNSESPYFMLAGIKNVEDFDKTKNAIQDLFNNQFLLAYQQKTTETQNEPLEIYALKNNDKKIEVNKYIDEVKVNFDERGFANLALSFNALGSALFANLTSQNVGKYIAITVDEMVIMAPRVSGEITGGKLEISGRFELKELESLKSLIESGYLPFELKIASENIEK